MQTALMGPGLLCCLSQTGNIVGSQEGRPPSSNPTCSTSGPPLTQTKALNSRTWCAAIQASAEVSLLSRLILSRLLVCTGACPCSNSLRRSNPLWHFVRPTPMRHMYDHAQGRLGKLLGISRVSAHRSTAQVHLVEPRFNRLTVFDGRYPHGVRPVEGTRDPLKARLVLHGWFTDPHAILRG